ncbi:MAG: hypothetical protein KDB22_20070 [Planctomycetales bacterium]|nr:hypothetical protein [Planctomycetales bacterium]
MKLSPKPLGNSLTRILSVVLVVLIGPQVPAQNPFDSPFGEPTSPTNSDPASGVFGGRGDEGTATPPATAVQDEPDADPMVRLLRARQPSTAEELVSAIKWMSRIDRYDEVGRWLDVLKQKNFSEDQLDQLSRLGGSALWMRLRAHASDMTEEQAQLVKEILMVPARLARDPNQIDQWIDQLVEKDVGKRHLTQLRLQDAGNNALKRLADRLLQGDERVSQVVLAETAVMFGDSGIDALRAGLFVLDPASAGRAVSALSQVSGNNFSLELAASLQSTTLTADTKQHLVEQLQLRFGRLPNEEQVQQHLANSLQSSLLLYQQSRTSSSGIMNVLWRPAAGGMTVEYIEAPAHICRLERLAQLAALDLQQPDSNTQRSDRNLAILLQRDFQATSGASASGAVQPFTPALSTSTATADSVFDTLQRAFYKAGEMQMHGGAVAALERIAAETRLQPSRAPLEFLGGLLTDPRQPIRYAALETIATIQPKEPFAAAETALNIALEMTRLTVGPNALVIGMHADRRQIAQHQIEMQTSGEVSSVHSARAAFIALQQLEPIELIVLVDRVADLSIYQLIQRLRNGRASHSLPIVVLTEELYAYERELIERTPGVIQSILSNNAEQMPRVLNAAFALLDSPPLSVAQRSKYSLTASQFLAEVANDRQRFAFYPIGDLRGQLINAKGSFSTAKRIQLLSGLGSMASQRALVDIAASGAFGESDRLAAAQAFGKSVRSFGMALSESDIASSYERYNQLGPTDPTAVKALGLILDVTEAQAGKIDWPAILSQPAPQ